MNARAYPVSVEDMPAWARRAGVTASEARKRLAQYVVLECIACAPWRDQLCFKGGNALRFIHFNPRSTIDLDFTAVGGFPDDDKQIREKRQDAVKSGYARFSLKLRGQRIKRDPQRSEATIPTWNVTIGFQLPGDRHFADFEQHTRPFNEVVEIEISINDVVCESMTRAIGAQGTTSLRVCALEDILAEKLRALLQSPIRNRERHQVVYDIARMVRQCGAGLNRSKTAEFLRRKCEARDISPRKSSFDPEVRRRASNQYHHLLAGLGPHAIPFDDAWNEVLTLVSSLEIPD